MTIWFWTALDLVSVCMIRSLEISLTQRLARYLFTLDELQSASIANSEEKQDITGKQGRKLTSLKKNKSVTVSGTNDLNGVHRKHIPT